MKHNKIFSVVFKFVLVLSLSHSMHTHRTDNTCTQLGSLAKWSLDIISSSRLVHTTQLTNKANQFRCPQAITTLRFHNNTSLYYHWGNYKWDYYSRFLPLEIRHPSSSHPHPLELNTHDWIYRLQPWHSEGLPASSESCRQSGPPSCCAHCPQRLKFAHTDIHSNYWDVQAKLLT